MLFALEALEFTAQADTSDSVEMYPNAPYISATVSRQNKASKQMHASPTVVPSVGVAHSSPFSSSFPTAVRPGAASNSYSTPHAPYTQHTKRESATSPTFSYSMPVLGSSKSKSVAVGSVSSYNFDDHNAFGANYIRKNSQSEMPMIDPDNPDDELLNPLPLGNDVLVLSLLSMMYAGYLFLTKSFGRKYLKLLVARAVRRKVPAKQLGMVAVLLIVSTGIGANNLKISNVAVAAKDTAVNYRDIRFDIQWENSWRVTNGPSNYDAAWVFIKYSTDQGATWKHAHLSNVANAVGTGTVSQFVPGLLQPNVAYHSITNPVLGVFLQRAGAGSGTFVNTGAKLRWNYGDNGVLDTEHVMFKVFAIEMVYVPQGAFYVGDGAQTEIAGQLSDASNTKLPFYISSENAIVLGGVAAGNLGSNNRVGMSAEWVDDFHNSQTQNLPGAYPKGFNGFYSMKYELSQQQYVDFLNTLTRTQQNTRTNTNLAVGVTSVSNRFVMSNTSSMSYRNAIRCDASISADAAVRFYCDANGNGVGGEEADGLAVACNYINWSDGLAYADWAGLRPMTELEYEKAARGPIAAITDEFSWGTSYVSNVPFTVENLGSSSERINSGYSTVAGNAVYADTYSNPLRVGVFAAHASNNGRVSSGASFYGVMELSGNLWERTVMLGAGSGRAYTGVHGNGLVSVNGNATQSSWPGSVNAEVQDEKGGFRGGAVEHVEERMRVSDRYIASFFSTTQRYQTRGFRAVRSY